MRGLPRVIWVLGVASLLNDVSSEAIFPLLPVFLTSLGAPMRFIGLIEGSADALGERPQGRSPGGCPIAGRGRLFVVGGYTIPALARAAIAAALAPWHVLAARLLDRTGQGHSLRAARRDDRRVGAAIAARARLRPQPFDGSFRRGARTAARERAAVGRRSTCAWCS